MPGIAVAPRVLPPGADEQLHLMNHALALMRGAHADITGAHHDATIRELMNTLVRVQAVGSDCDQRPASKDHQGGGASACGGHRPELEAAD
jgi:hypothetical protein